MGPSALAVFAVLFLLVLPGMTFLATFRRHRPLSRPFKDTADVLVYGSIFFVVALVAAGVAHTFGVSAIADFPALVRTTTRNEYIATNLWRITFTTLSVVGTSCGLAYVVASALSSQRLRRKRAQYYSSFDPWWLTFSVEAKHFGPRHVLVLLDDTAIVGGYLLWFSSEESDYGARDLVLCPWSNGPVLSTISESQAVAWLNEQPVITYERRRRIIIPGGRIVRIHVRFLTRQSLRPIEELVTSEVGKDVKSELWTNDDLPLRIFPNGAGLEVLTLDYQAQRLAVNRSALTRQRARALLHSAGERPTKLSRRRLRRFSVGSARKGTSATTVVAESDRRIVHFLLTSGQSDGEAEVVNVASEASGSEEGASEASGSEEGASEASGGEEVASEEVASEEGASEEVGSEEVGR